MRAPDRTPKGWDWRDTLDNPADAPEAVGVHSDADARIVGTILGPSGEPLHTVKKAGSVDFGYRRTR